MRSVCSRLCICSAAPWPGPGTRRGAGPAGAPAGGPPCPGSRGEPGGEHYRFYFITIIISIYFKLVTKVREIFTIIEKVSSHKI